MNDISSLAEPTKRVCLWRRTLSGDLYDENYLHALKKKWDNEKLGYLTDKE